MPYGKVRKYKKYSKGRGRRTPWYNKKYSAMEVASKAWSAAKYLKGLINVEQKFFDYGQSDVKISTTASVYALSQIGAGDAYNQRDGNSILAKSLLMRISAVLSTSAEQTFLRGIVVIDNEQNGTSPTASDILESSVDYVSPINHINGRRFTVIKDFMINLRKDMNAQFKKYYLKLNHHIKYSSTTASATKEGNMYLLLLSDQATNTPTIDFGSRIRFIDN